MTELKQLSSSSSLHHRAVSVHLSSVGETEERVEPQTPETRTVPAPKSLHTYSQNQCASLNLPVSGSSLNQPLFY